MMNKLSTNSWADIVKNGDTILPPFERLLNDLRYGKLAHDFELINVSRYSITFNYKKLKHKGDYPSLEVTYDNDTKNWLLGFLSTWIKQDPDRRQLSKVMVDSSKFWLSSLITEIEDDGQVFRLKDYVKDLLILENNLMLQEKDMLIKHLHKLGFKTYDQRDRVNCIYISQSHVYFECIKGYLEWKMQYKTHSMYYPQNVLDGSFRLNKFLNMSDMKSLIHTINDDDQEEYNELYW